MKRGRDVGSRKEEETEEKISDKEENKDRGER